MTDKNSSADVRSYRLQCVNPQALILEPTERAPRHARYHVFDWNAHNWTPGEPAHKAAAVWLAERALVTGCDARELLYRLLCERMERPGKRSVHKYKHARLDTACTLFCIDTLQELDRIIWDARLAA